MEVSIVLPRKLRLFARKSMFYVQCTVWLYIWILVGIGPSQPNMFTSHRLSDGWEKSETDTFLILSATSRQIAFGKVKLYWLYYWNLSGISFSEIPSIAPHPRWILEGRLWWWAQRARQRHLLQRCSWTSALAMADGRRLCKKKPLAQKSGSEFRRMCCRLIVCYTSIL